MVYYVEIINGIQAWYSNDFDTREEAEDYAERQRDLGFKANVKKG